MREELKKRFLLVMLVLFVAVVVAACCVYYIISTRRMKVFIQGYDVACLPGETVKLRAKVELDDPSGLRPDMKDVKVAFRYGEIELGTATTCDDGVAAMEFSFDKKGIHRLKCGLLNDSEFAWTPADLIVLVVGADEKIAITDIDYTIADVSEVEFLVKSNEEVPVVKDSVRVLTRVAEGHHIIYLTARDDRFMNKTKDWLRLRGFPEGPVLFRDLRLDTLSAEKYKTEVMAELGKRFSNMVFGFGERDEDARAYASQNVKSFIIGRKYDSLPDGATEVSGWAEVEKLIFGEENQK